MVALAWATYVSEVFLVSLWSHKRVEARFEKASFGSAEPAWRNSNSVHEKGSDMVTHTRCAISR